jgi:hypothetical protein
MAKSNSWLSSTADQDFAVTACREEDLVGVSSGLGLLFGLVSPFEEVLLADVMASVGRA